MKRWEHASVDCDDFDAVKSDAESRGDEGWELVAIVQREGKKFVASGTGARIEATSFCTCVYKRPKKVETKHCGGRVCGRGRTYGAPCICGCAECNPPKDE